MQYKNFFAILSAAISQMAASVVSKVNNAASSSVIFPTVIEDNLEQTPASEIC